MCCGRVTWTGEVKRPWHGFVKTLKGKIRRKFIKIKNFSRIFQKIIHKNYAEKEYNTTNFPSPSYTPTTHSILWTESKKSILINFLLFFSSKALQVHVIVSFFDLITLRKMQRWPHYMATTCSILSTESRESILINFLFIFSFRVFSLQTHTCHGRDDIHPWSH
jgi:hypothetical protein